MAKTATKRTTKAAAKTAKSATAKKAAKTTKKVVKKPVKKTATKVTKLKNFKSPVKKTELLNIIAETTDLTKKQVNSVLECLTDQIILGHINPKGNGSFTLPGVLKIEVKKKPATKARKGINPFTGEPTIFKAKPARNVVKIKALKKLKEMAEKKK